MQSTAPAPPPIEPVHDLNEQFAQTRAPDDLFSDDFTPSEELVPEVVEPVIPQGPRSRRGGRGRGTPRTHEGPPRTQNLARPLPETRTSGVDATAQDTPSTQAAPEGPRKEAVRGDRSRTGGLKQTKLTEEELSARMEAVKLKNANLEAAHARAEADQASFQAREAEAQEKRKQERQNRQQMMGEREKNRLRKLKAVGGREWDAEKDPAQTGNDQNGRSQFRRGAYGGVAPDRGSVRQPETEEVMSGATEGDDLRSGFRDRGHGRGRGRGRGAFGGGGGGGGVQGQRNSGTKQDVPTTADFPPLPGGGGQKQEKPATSDAPAAQPLADVKLPGQGTNWAEEMENISG